MSDKAEIHELLATYSDGVTHRDWAQVATVFAPDATWEVVGSQFKFQGDCAAGIKSIVTPANWLIQMVSSTVIKISGDSATARSTIQEAAEFDAGKFQPFAARMDTFGTYEDVMKKVGGKWKFASRRFTMINMKISRIEETIAQAAQ